MAVRILIVTGCPAICAGIRSWLDPTDDLQVIAETETAARALELASALRPDVALVEFQLPDDPGPIACRRILGVSPDTSALLMDDPQHDARLAAAAEAGASGLLSTKAHGQELIDALRQAAAGRELFTHAQRVRIRAWQEDIGRRVRSLSQREHAVLSHILAGKTNREIAGELSIMPSTVEKHIGSIFAKFEVTSRRAFFALALRERLEI